jgi:hypothetical protein
VTADGVVENVYPLPTLRDDSDWCSRQRDYLMVDASEATRRDASLPAPLQAAIDKTRQQISAQQKQVRIVPRLFERRLGKARLGLADFLFDGLPHRACRDQFPGMCRNA